MFVITTTSLEVFKEYLEYLIVHKGDLENNHPVLGQVILSDEVVVVIDRKHLKCNIIQSMKNEKLDPDTFH